MTLAAVERRKSGYMSQATARKQQPPEPTSIPPTLPELQALGLVETYSPRQAVKGWTYYRSARAHVKPQRFPDGFNGPFPKVLTHFIRADTPAKAIALAKEADRSEVVWDFT